MSIIRTLAVAAVVFALPLAVLAAEKQTLQVEGSTTVGPIADAFAEWFGKNKDAQITVKKTGSGDGAAALIDGRCDVATMSRFMKPEEFKAAVEKGVMPVAQAIAMDGVCIVVHQSNPVKGLTIEQIRKIYTGEYTNWNQLGGPDLKIVPVSRDSSSGTYETFEGMVMNKQKMAGGVQYVNSNPAAQAAIQQTPGAIGYVGLAFQDGVKTLTVNDIKPDRETITTGKYPIARPLFMFTNGYPKLGSPAHAFVAFFLSEEGQKIIEAQGFVPMTNY